MELIIKFICNVMFPKQETAALFEYHHSGSGQINLHNIVQNDPKVFLRPTGAQGNVKNKILLSSKKFQWGFLEIGDAYFLDLLLNHCGYQLYYLDANHAIKQITALTQFFDCYSAIACYEYTVAHHFISQNNFNPAEFHIVTTQNYERCLWQLNEIKDNCNWGQYTDLRVTKPLYCIEQNIFNIDEVANMQAQTSYAPTYYTIFSPSEVAAVLAKLSGDKGRCLLNCVCRITGTDLTLPDHLEAYHGCFPANYPRSLLSLSLSARLETEDDIQLLQTALEFIRTSQLVELKLSLRVVGLTITKKTFIIRCPNTLRYINVFHDSGDAQFLNLQYDLRPCQLTHFFANFKLNPRMFLATPKQKFFVDWQVEHSNIVFDYKKFDYKKSSELLRKGLFNDYSFWGSRKETSNPNAVYAALQDSWDMTHARDVNLIGCLENCYYLFWDMRYRNVMLDDINFLFTKLTHLQVMVVRDNCEISIYKRGETGTPRIIVLNNTDPQVYPSHTYMAQHGSLNPSTPQLSFAKIKKIGQVVEMDRLQIFIRDQSGYLVNSDHYRCETLNHFTLTEGARITFSNTQPTPLTTTSIKFPEYAEYTVEINGQWSAGDYHLPHLSAHDAFLELPAEWLIVADPILATRRLTVNEPSNFTLKYKIHSPQFTTIDWDGYKPKPFYSPVAEQLKKLIPAMLKEKLRDSENQTVCLTQLIEYFRSFTNIIESPNFPSDIAALRYCLERKVGSCLHRSQAFMLIATACKLQARIAMNNIHAWVEVAYQNKHTPDDRAILWRAFDLGGTNAEYLKSGGTAPPNGAVTVIASPAVTQLLSASSIQPRAAAQLSIVQHANMQTAWPRLWQKGVKPSLIVLKSEQDAWGLWHSLNETISPDSLCMHVQCPTDFERLWQTRTIVNNRIIQIDGVLKTAVSEARPLFMLINWSHFDDTSRASYLSLLDPQPRLFSHELPNSIHCIHAFKGEPNALGKAFLSRIHPQSITTLASVSLPRDRHLAKNPLQVNLYQLPLWKDQLLGTISATRNPDGTLHWNQAMGLLATAIQENRALVLQNLPDDPALQQLIDGINYGRYCYLEGKYQAITRSSCYIYVETHEPATEKPPFLIEAMGIKGQTSKQTYYLSRTSYWNFFGNATVDEHGYQLSAGWFVDWKAENLLIVTETLTTFEWQALCDFFKAKNPAQPLRYICLASISTPWQEASDLAVPKFRIMQSNDPYYTAVTQFPVATQVRVSNQDNYGDIMDRLQASQNDLSQSIEIQWCATDLYRQLVQQKSNVVLIGALAPPVMQRLLPLLANEIPATFDTAQGNKTDWQGTLYWIAPTDQPLPAITTTTVTHEHAEYQTRLREITQGPIDNNIAGLLDAWFDFLKKYPSPKHLPQKSILDYQYWCACYDHLHEVTHSDTIPHRNNPLKMMLYDYQPGSEWYCFLNVAAKLHFRALLPTPSSPFYQRQGVPNSQPWALINRYSVAGLTRVFQSLKLLVGMVSQANNDVPQLKNFDGIIADLAATSSVVVPAKTRTHLEKPAQQLNWFLGEQRQWRIAFLKSDFGLGKTHLIRQTLRAGGYQVEEDITKWLAVIKNTPKCVLLLDEANLQAEGSFEFLYGLAANRLFYQGKFYDIHESAKVIATGNPEHYPGRTYHQLLRQAYVIIVKAANYEFFKQLFIEKMGFNWHNPANIESLWRIYQLGSLWLAPLQQSIRDMEYLIDYFKQSGQAMIDDSLREKMAFDLYYFRKPDALFSTWRTLYQTAFPETRLTEPYSLRLRFMATLQQHVAYQRHVLIEGNSGTGKSHLLQQITATKPRIILQGGQPGVEQAFISGFKIGKIVIVDELNIKPDERLYNNLLTGVDEHGHALENKSAQLLATQNPSFYQGRTSISNALKNRFITLYVPAITQQDLKDIAQENRIAPAKVDEFIRQNPITNEGYNLRDFFAFCQAI